MFFGENSGVNQFGVEGLGDGETDTNIAETGFGSDFVEPGVSENGEVFSPAKDKIFETATEGLARIGEGTEPFEVGLEKFANSVVPICAPHTNIPPWLHPP